LFAPNRLDSLGKGLRANIKAVSTVLVVALGGGGYVADNFLLRVEGIMVDVADVFKLAGADPVVLRVWFPTETVCSPGVIISIRGRRFSAVTTMPTFVIDDSMI